MVTGGDAVCAALEALGVDTVFGIPSQHNLGLYDAFARRNSIRLVVARHEAGAVHEADGYARATGRLGVAIVSTGPGTTNAMTGLYEAGFASSPVLLITTREDRPFIGQDRGYIHDAPGQTAMLRTVTRRSELVWQADAIADAILSVAADIRSGRPQPGCVEIPTDLLVARAAVPACELRPSFVPAFDPAKVDEAAALLAAAKKPLLWIGGGCQAGAGAVRALAEKLGCPVVSTLNGRGVVSSDDPLNLGTQTHYPPFRPLLEEADVVLAIGTRFQAVASWFWSLPMPEKLIRVDIDAAQLSRNYRPRVAIEGDAAAVAGAISARLAPPAVDAGYLARAREVRAALAAETATRIGRDHARIADLVDELAPADRNLVVDATMTGTTWGSHRLPTRAPRRFAYVTSLAIGPALPLGVGAAIGSGRRTVVLHGDGGIMLSLGELATAVETAAPVTVLVFNNRGYGGLKYLQTLAGAANIAVDLHTPDFVKLADAMGMPAWHAKTVDEFAAAFAAAMKTPGPGLIETDITGMEPLAM